MVISLSGYRFSLQLTKSATALNIQLKDLNLGALYQKADNYSYRCSIESIATIPVLTSSKSIDTETNSEETFESDKDQPHGSNGEDHGANMNLCTGLENMPFQCYICDGLFASNVLLQVCTFNSNKHFIHSDIIVIIFLRDT